MQIQTMHILDWIFWATYSGLHMWAMYILGCSSVPQILGCMYSSYSGPCIFWALHTGLRTLHRWLSLDELTYYDTLLVRCLNFKWDTLLRQVSQISLKDLPRCIHLQDSNIFFQPYILCKKAKVWNRMIKRQKTFFLCKLFSYNEENFWSS